MNIREYSSFYTPVFAAEMSVKVSDMQSSCLENFSSPVYLLSQVLDMQILVLCSWVRKEAKYLNCILLMLLWKQDTWPSESLASKVSSILTPSTTFTSSWNRFGNSSWGTKGCRRSWSLLQDKKEEGVETENQIVFSLRSPKPHKLIPNFLVYQWLLFSQSSFSSVSLSECIPLPSFVCWIVVRFLSQWICTRRRFGRKLLSCFQKQNLLLFHSQSESFILPKVFIISLCVSWLTSWISFFHP